MTPFTKLGAATLAAFLVTSQMSPPALAQMTQAQRDIRMDNHFDGLLRHDGKLFHQRDLAGKPTLIFFGFTSCGSVCPMGLNTITLTAEELARRHGSAAVPNLLFVTTLPTHEGAEMLAGYLRHFHPDFIGLTAQKGIEALQGDPAALRKVQQIENVLDRFRVVRAGHHSPFAYLMDGQGHFLGKPLNTQDGPDKLAAEIAALLNLKTDLAVYPAR